jgi:hypothetical protein
MQGISAAKARRKDEDPLDQIERELAAEEEAAPRKPKRRRKLRGNGPTPGPDILDPRDPMQAARALVAARLTDEQGRRLIHRYRGTFWRFRENHYVLADQENVRAAVWAFLETAQRRSDKEITDARLGSRSDQAAITGHRRLGKPDTARYWDARCRCAWALYRRPGN